MKQSTVCLVTKLYIGEMPYINQFIKYYISIGVSKFYIINTHKNTYQQVHNYLREYIPKYIQLQNILNDDDNINSCQNQIFNQIKEEYIINCDCDEFLITYPFRNINHMINHRNADLYYFQWRLMPNDNETTKHMALKTFDGSRYKYMVKRKCVKSLGVHDPIIIENIKSTIKTHHSYNMLHIWSRSLNDPIIKCLMQKFNDIKSSSVEHIRACLKKYNLPPRLKAVAYLNKIEKSDKLPPTIKKNIVNVNSGIEESIILQHITRDELQTIKKIYYVFKNQINIHSFDFTPDTSQIIDITRTMKYIKVDLCNKSNKELITHDTRIYIKIPYIKYVDAEPQKCIDVLSNNPKKYIDMESFTFVCNPITRLQFYFTSQDTYKDISFNEFIENHLYEIDLEPMHKYICNSDYNILVDKIYRYEDLENAETFEEVISETTIEKIKNKYKLDFQLFNYQTN